MIPIAITTTDGTTTYTALPGFPQSMQTNQTIFPPVSTPPRIVLLTTGSGSIVVASYPSLETLHTLHAHTSSCLTLALSPTGRYLATGGSDAIICLWDTHDWVCRRTLGRMVGAVKAVSFSWDGAYVVGGSDEGNGLEIAHAETGEYVCSVPTSLPAPCVAWHPSRYWLAYTGDAGGLKIIGAAGGSL